ncbi:hypothetical protein Aglo01_52570 [Actinokineospora globicatena]|nr:hypothetical protein Aglo01_52570 [Actinokineospora globicatena]GLW87603.1 hypothetical protein Aglo02_52420 [Actinokineospora globicatena]
MHVHAERPVTEAEERGLGQGTVGGRGVALGGCCGHGDHPPRSARAPGPHRRKPRDLRPSMRMVVDHTVDAWHADPMSATEVFLVARRHVDFQRVSSAMCRQHP